jgi:NAD(P)-dependent dehydrogenase (short-subunit alcohol dehydrogenase family)
MQGRVMAITGGFGALGAVVAERALARGARVAAIDLAAKGPPARDGFLPLGGVDVADLAAAQRAVTAIQEKFARLDGLINIAGGFAWQTLADGDLAGWDRLYAINVKTAATMCKAALPALQASGAGRIVNVGAAAALKAGAGMGAYAAAKAGVMRLTEALAEELKDKNVTVNAVLPSIIDTPANRKNMPKADFSRWVSPADLAAVILFLASQEASAVTGALIPVVGRV